MIVFGTAVTDPETYDRCAAPGHPTRRRARLDRPRPPDRRLAVPQLQPAARQGGRPRGPRGARPPPPGRRARRLGLRREGEGGAGRPRRRDRRLRRRRRGAQHRLVAGRAHLGGADPPLPGVRRRRLPGRSPGDPRLAPVLRQHRRGGLDRRLRHGALALGRAQAALRRVAGQAARLRLRHLHAGAGRRQEGGDRRLPRDPPPLARADQRSRDLDPDLHQAGGEVGRPASRDGGGSAAAGAARRGGGGLREGDHGRPPDARAGDQAPAGARAAGARDQQAASSRRRRQELEAARRELRSRRRAGTSSARRATSRLRRLPAKASAIDYAVEQLGIESFASLEIGRTPTASTPSTRSTSRACGAERLSMSAPGAPAITC